MGLNMNYSLLMEGANSKFQIPEYRPLYNSDAYTESYMIQSLIEFKSILRDAQNTLNEISSDSYMLDEGAKEIASNIMHGILAALKKIKDAIIKIGKIIIDAILKAIAKIKSAINDKEEENFRKKRGYEILKQIDKALEKCDPSEKYLIIADIQPTMDLMNNKFPDTSAITGDTSKVIHDTIMLYTANLSIKSGDQNIGYDTAHSDSFTKFIEDQREIMISKIFGKYQYSLDDITGSAREAALKAFGDTKTSEVNLSSSLYSLACDNLEKGKDILKSLEEENKKVKATYDEFVKDIELAEKTAINIQNRKDLRTGFDILAKELAANISRLCNVFNTIISADYTIMSQKVKRANQVFGNSAEGSFAVRHACHKLIKKYIDESIEESVNGFDEVSESYEMQDSFDSAILMIEEAFLEQEFTGNIEKALLEADEQNAQPANQQATAKPGIGDSNAAAVVEKIVATAVETFEKWKQRVAELFNKGDKQFWEANRAKIQGADFGATKVNQWYSFNIPNLMKSTFIPFNSDNDTFKSDENTQKAFFDLLGVNPQQDQNNNNQNESFSKRFSRVFYTAYTKEENTIAAIDQNARSGNDPAFKYVNDYVTGANDSAMAVVNKDTDSIKRDKDNSKNGRDAYINKQKATGGQTTQTTQQTTTQQTQQNTEPANATSGNGAVAQVTANATQQAQQNSAIISDERFNLAEHFGLVNEQPLLAIFEAVVSGQPNLGEGTTGDPGKDYDAMRARCYKYNSFALTAKMTQSLAAYKQYMALYKSAFKAQQPAQNDQNQQPQNNTQQ